MDCNVVGLIAFDQVLRCISRRMMHVPLEFHVRSDPFDDDSADMARLGVPSDMVADLESFGHC